MTHTQRPILGQIIPAFTLPSSDMGPINTADYRGQKHLLIYFMREFSCTMCRSVVADLVKNEASLRQQDVLPLVIGGGTVKQARMVARLYKVRFPILADEERAIYQRFGLDKVLFAIQRSATALIDKEGKLRFFHATTMPGASFDLEAVREMVRQLNAETSLSTQP